MDQGEKLMIGYSFLIRQVPDVARFGYKKNLSRTLRFIFILCFAKDLNFFGKDQQQLL
jgi:hypothetical protein